MQHPRNYHDRDWLIEHYVTQGLSCRDCARASGYSITPIVIHEWLRKHNIPTRGVNDHMKGDRNPRLGTHLSEETRAKIARGLRGKKRSPESVAKQRAKVSGAKNVNFGKRIHGRGAWILSDGLSAPIRMRSRWEVFFADWLNRQHLAWEYEPRTFVLADGSAYTPDFLVGGIYYELKGYMTEGDARKIAGFRASYPELPLEVVGKDGMLARGIDPTKYVVTTVTMTDPRVRLCRTCGKPFTHGKRSQVICSRACYTKKPYAPRVEMPCAVCGKLFTKYASNTTRTTCSKQCGCVLGASKHTGANHWTQRRRTS